MAVSLNLESDKTCLFISINYYWDVCINKLSEDLIMVSLSSKRY